MAVAELDVQDWRRRVFELYAAVREIADPERAHLLWRATRDELHAAHPASPLAGPERRAFAGLPVYPYDPAARVAAEIEPASGPARELPVSSGEPVRFRRLGLARFTLGGETRSLPLYWLEGYAGGLFLPFSDETSGRETYGGGRYLLDAAKGADLGVEDGRLVLDFNFAYHPSCAHDPRWSCPLPGAESRLALAVRAGERLPG